MIKTTFFIVDVFAETRYSGNQLAVVENAQKYRYFGGETIDLRSEQGYEVGRPSLLFLKAEQKAQGIDVSVGGKAIVIAQGQLV